MGVVTLTGHLGAMGHVAELVAEELKYRLVERELVAETAAALGWPLDKAAEFDERPGGIRERLLDSVDRFAWCQMDSSDLLAAFAVTHAVAGPIAAPAGQRYFEELRRLIRTLADEGDVVIVGRGGQAMLAGRTDAVHIRVACPVDERARRVAARDHISLESARALVDHSDQQREARHMRYLGIDYRSPYHYSLVVNTGELPDAVAAGLIVAAAQCQPGVLAS